MQDHLKKYIESISSKFSHEETSEMGSCTNFEILLKGVLRYKKEDLLKFVNEN